MKIALAIETELRAFMMAEKIYDFILQHVVDEKILLNVHLKMGNSFWFEKYWRNRKLNVNILKGSVTTACNDMFKDVDAVVVVWRGKMDENQRFQELIEKVRRKKIKLIVFNTSVHYRLDEFRPLMKNPSTGKLEGFNDEVLSVHNSIAIAA